MTFALVPYYLTIFAMATIITVTIARFVMAIWWMRRGGIATTSDLVLLDVGQLFEAIERPAMLWLAGSLFIVLLRGSW